MRAKRREVTVELFLVTELPEDTSGLHSHAPLHEQRSRRLHDGPGPRSRAERGDFEKMQKNSRSEGV